jgi:hypothetical protein
MKTLAIRTIAALTYASVTLVTADAIFSASDSVLLVVGFFAWMVACAMLFAYAVARTTGRSPAFVLPVVLSSTLLQIAAVDVMVAQVMGHTLVSALQDLPRALVGSMATEPLLYIAWFGAPVLAAGTVLYFRWGLEKP